MSTERTDGFPTKDDVKRVAEELPLEGNDRWARFCREILTPGVILDLFAEWDEVAGDRAEFETLVAHNLAGWKSADERETALRTERKQVLDALGTRRTADPVSKAALLKCHLDRAITDETALQTALAAAMIHIAQIIAAWRQGADCLAKDIRDVEEQMKRWHALIADAGRRVTDARKDFPE